MPQTLKRKASSDAQPVVPRVQYAIPLPWEERERHLAFAKMHGLGLEVTAFCSGPALNDTAVRKERARALKKDLREWSTALSYHGAFMDISLHSRDDEFAALSRRRVERDLETAADLGCKKVVFHTGFHPHIPSARYPAELVEGHAAWWNTALDRFPGLTVCLENTFEADPTLFQQIFKRANHPRLRMCFDVAHANVFSAEGPERWIRQLGTWLSHMHWNDNSGDRDTHWAVGDGSVRWAEIWAAVGELQRELTVVLELGGLANIQRSLASLEKRGMWEPGKVRKRA